MGRGKLTTGLLVLASTIIFSLPAEAQGNGQDCGGNRGRGGSLMIIGLTSDQRLICFGEANPANAGNAGQITGLAGDTRLVGIDFRPATGELYGLGDEGGLYVIDVRDASATFRAQLNVDLAGTVFDIDFNPTVDRLRIISNTGQNLRVNVADGAVTTDAALNNPDPVQNVTGAAYTNNDFDAGTGTTLYGISSGTDQLVIQAPPNGGSINATGRLNVDAGTDVGFDIYSKLRGGVTTDVQAYASLVVGGRSRLYRINLFTGQATSRGVFRTRDQVIDIAIPLT